MANVEPGESAPAPEASPEQTAAQSIDEMSAASAERVMSDTPVEELLPDDAPYRDAKPLRDEIAAAREQYGPAAAALGQVPEGMRDSYLAFGPAYALAATDPSLGSDIGFLQASYPNLAPEDRQVLDAVIGDVRSNPGQSAELLREAAGLLRGDETETADDDVATADDFGYEADDPNRPMTMADYERMRDQERVDAEQERNIETQANAILTEARGLGYLPDSTDPVERAEWNTLIAVARELPDGSIAKAHEILQARNQKIIDQYVSGKTADADRPQPPESGVPDSGERRLESMDDMNRAMRERILSGGT